MKRLACVLLLLCALCGCSDPTATDTDTALPGASGPAAESSTLLKSVSLAGYDSAVTLAIGRDLLLVEEEKLTLVDGMDLSVVTSQQIEGLPALESGQLWASDSGVAYYDKDSHSIIFLNTNLRQSRAVELPADLLGSPWLSPDQTTVYYTTQTAIRALDLRTGTSRLLKEQGTVFQSISGVFLNGTALRCEAKQADGTVRISMISTQNGAFLQESADLRNLIGPGEWYFLPLNNTCVTQLVFGKADGALKNLWPEGEITAWWPLPEQGRIVTARESEGRTVLDCYSMETGARFAVLYLPELTEILDFSAGSNGIIWFRSSTTLYRWDTSVANTVDKHNYAPPLSTQENPDEAGLAAMDAALQPLEQRYGVDIVIGEAAAALAPQNYSFETEFVPQAYNKPIALLTNLMAQFPDNFFTLAADRFPSEKLTIILVRNIYGNSENRTLAPAGGIQYLLDGNPYIALSILGEQERNFYHQIGHIIDSRVLSTCAVLYEWHKVNPPGFQYDKDYNANLNRKDYQYLQDADRWFIDTYSMSFEIEDRSRIFEYASLPGNENYFLSPNIQVKLKRICDGIRQSFGLQNDSRQFVWEQYLQK